MKTSLLFLCRQAPYGSSRARDALDAVLASAAYDQDLSVLFLDDGVLQLLPDQEAHQIGQKSISALLPAFELYDIEKIYVDTDSLTGRGIAPEELLDIGVTPLNNEAVKHLIAQQQHVLSF